MPPLVVLDLLFRGTVCGALVILLSVSLIRRGNHPIGRFGALFYLGTIAYTLLSSPQVREALAPARPLIYLIAKFNAVFFWYFILVLFNDRHQWRWWHGIPIVVLAATIPIQNTPFPGTSLDMGFWLHQMVVATVLTHVVYLAVRDLGDDLVEPRRRFRISLSVLAVLLAVGIIIGEVFEETSELPTTVMLIQSVSLAFLSISFTIWALEPRAFLYPEPSFAAVPDAQSVAETEPRSSPADAIDINRIDAAMTDGVWRQEGLTVSTFAQSLGMPEHRLRRLINQDLGFRNFSAFLNTYRIDEARKILSNPDRARDQILTIALEVGYGSIGPFNRAFKEANGVTPTEFRATSLAALRDSPDQS